MPNVLAPVPRDVILVSQAKRLLAESRDLDFVKDIRDKAEALRLYLQKAKDSLDAQNDAAEIKVRAEICAGEILRGLKLNRGRRSDLRSPDKTNLVAGSDQVPKRFTLDELGISKSQSSRWKTMATLQPDAVDGYMERMRNDEHRITSAGILKLAKGLVNARSVAAPIIQPDTSTSEFLISLDGLLFDCRSFGCIYADPPWRYNNRASRGAAENHYSTMSLEEIAQLPIAELASPDAHLHLWTTNAFLFDAKAIMEKWGFKYTSCFVWVKPHIGVGNFWRISHEFLLLGIRGTCPFKVHDQRSWIEHERTCHSEKPDKVRTLIEKVSPGPYLELFGRKSVSNWTVFGNEHSS